jgi:hypothetical protein
MFPREQLTTAPPVQVPAELVADTNVVPAGTGSATFTPVAGLGPAFVTVIVQVIWFPRVAGFGLPDFVIDKSILGAGGAGGGGGTALTVTGAVSVAVTSGPTGGCPVAVAEFVNELVTFASEHVYVELWPFAKAPIALAQPGA